MALRVEVIKAGGIYTRWRISSGRNPEAMREMFDEIIRNSDPEYILDFYEQVLTDFLRHSMSGAAVVGPDRPETPLRPRLDFRVWPGQVRVSFSKEPSEEARLAVRCLTDIYCVRNAMEEGEDGYATARAFWLARNIERLTVLSAEPDAERGQSVRRGASKGGRKRGQHLASRDAMLRAQFEELRLAKPNRSEAWICRELAKQQPKGAYKPIGVERIRQVVTEMRKRS